MLFLKIIKINLFTFFLLELDNFYLINLEPHGFIIISAQENIIPLIDSTSGVGHKRIFPLIAAPLTAVTDTAEERERLIDEKKKMLAFLYSTPSYTPTLNLLGFRDLGVDLRKRFSAGEGEENYRLIPDELFHQVVIACSFDGLADEVHERFGRLVSGITLRPPVDTKYDDAFSSSIEKLKEK